MSTERDTMTETERRVMNLLYPPGVEVKRLEIKAHLEYDEDGNCRVVNSLTGESSSIEEVRAALEDLGRWAEQSR